MVGLVVGFCAGPDRRHQSRRKLCRQQLVVQLGMVGLVLVRTSRGKPNMGLREGRADSTPIPDASLCRRPRVLVGLASGDGFAGDELANGSSPGRLALGHEHPDDPASRLTAEQRPDQPTAAR